MSAAASFEIATDLSRIDLNKVHVWLSTDAYWALGRPLEVVQRAAEASLNFGAFDEHGDLRGYARLVTDGATFGWLCDVYVERACRGQGLGILLAEAVVEAVRPMGLKRLLLMTQHSHSLYERVGFEVFPEPHKVMSLTLNKQPPSVITRDT